MNPSGIYIKLSVKFRRKFEPDKELQILLVRRYKQNSLI